MGTGSRFLVVAFGILAKGRMRSEGLGLEVHIGALPLEIIGNRIA